MSLNPRVCKKSYKVHIPMMGEACEFWLITVTDEQSITNPDKDHAYLTDDGKLFVFNGDSLVRVNCDICFTQEEREKLEGIEENANNYTLPEADSNKLGGVVLGYTQNGKNYPVVKDSDGRIYVQVPWVYYSLPKAEDDQLGGIKTGYEQNGKYYPVKVDTNGNAYVNVPWTDTNTVYEVVSNTSDGLAPMLPSENPDKKYLNGDGEWVENDAKSIEINGVNVTGSFYSGETSDCGVEITKVVGKTTQQTTNGYQLFDSSKVETKTSGGATVTNNNDGSFTISGSGNLTETFSNLFNYSKEESLKLLKAGIYRSNVENTTPQIRFGLRNASTMSYVSNKCITSSIKSITLTEEDIQSVEDGTNILSIGFYGSNNNAIVTGTVKPMVYIEGDGTWEPFTGGKPAPNPDYPMDIENVEISNIISHGRQLFDSSKLATKSQGGATVTNNGDGSFTVSGSGNLTERFLSNDTYVEMPFILKEGKLYLSCESEVYPAPYIDFAGDDGFIVSIYIPRGSKKVEINLTNEQVSKINKIKYIFVGNAGLSIIGGTIKPMLYQDGDGTWEPFKNATVETSLTLAEGATYENGQVTNNFVNENLGDLFATIGVSSDPKWYNPESSYSYELTEPKVKLNASSPGKCTHFQSYNFASFYNKGIETGIMNNQSYCVVNISKSLGICTTVEEFKEWIQEQDVRVLKKLATPTTEEFKVPTIPSYYPYTEISTNSVVDPTITFRPLPFTTCLVGEATEEESGYMPPLSGNSNEYLNGNGEWAVPPNTTYEVASTSANGLMSSSDKTKLTNLRRIWKGTSSSPPSGWVDGDIYVQYEE